MTDLSAVRAAAMTLMAQYGEDAEVIAVLRAAELAAEGDVDGLAHWDAVIALISQIGDGRTGSSLLN